MNEDFSYNIFEGSKRNNARNTILYEMVVKQITASNADELMEQREQNQACLGYAESRQKKTEGQKIKQLYDMQLEVLKYKKSPSFRGT